MRRRKRFETKNKKKIGGTEGKGRDIRNDDPHQDRKIQKNTEIIQNCEIIYIH